MKSKKVITTMMAVLVVILLAASGVTASPPTAAYDTSCVDFEGLPLGTEYHVGDTFTESGVFMKIDSFQWSNGEWTDGGYASVGNEGLVGALGQEVFLNNVIMHFDFGGSCEGLSLLYGAYGGNLNIDINGDFRNFGVFDDIDGSIIGGVNVAINDFGSGKGSLTLSGTIEGFFIGGQELVIDHVCSEVQPAEKPDLIITDVWSEDSTICYQIRNTGAAVARAGHYTGLSIDGVQEMLDHVSVDLAPGERLKRCFDYDWVCTRAEDTIKVCGDYSDDIAESDEANNCREETWKCDGTPPTIVSGPTVSKITTNSALVSWDTDEASDSSVTYDKAAGKYDFENTASSLVRNHEITLTGLEPSTAYHFVVRSTDSSGNTVQSKDIAFETLATPDYEDPVISIVDPVGCTGMTKITAVASDNTGVEKVEFYLEGELIYTDYSSSSPNYEFVLDTDRYASGIYDLIAKASDTFGNLVTVAGQVEVCEVPIDIQFPRVWITNPSPWDTVSGTISVEVEVSDDFVVGYVDLYVDNIKKGRDGSFPYTYLWNTGDVSDGQHTIMAKAYDLGGHLVSSGSIAVMTDNPNAILVLSRSNVTWEGNYFTTVLNVTNVGDAEATGILIIDCYQGFQCVSQTDARSQENAVYDVEASYLLDTSTSCAEIKYHKPLGPGESDYITVSFVPVLFPSHVEYKLGDFTEVGYKFGAGDSCFEQVSLAPFELQVHQAIKEADYLIVTNPENLFAFNNATSVNNLLSAMADLATLKNGVLGYLYGPASLLTEFEGYYALACGDVNGDYYADIIVAQNDGPKKGEVHICNVTRSTWQDNAFERLATSFDGHDRLACGDVDGDYKAEIIVANYDDGSVDIYGYNYNHTLKLWEYRQEGSPLPTSFDLGDGLACGDVDQDGKAEIIVAEDTDGMVYIYGYDPSTMAYREEGSALDTTFDAGDGLACGDVDGQGASEIIVAKDDDHRIYIYSTGGLKDSLLTTFDRYDGLACGDVDGQGAAEIVVADHDSGRLDIWSSGVQQPSKDSNFGGLDNLACGDVDLDGQAEIIVADTKYGWIDMVTYGPSPGDRNLLDDLTNAGGSWSNQLCTGWADNGYLLIVGETEIIPAWAQEVDSDTYRIHEVVRCSDSKYASTHDESFIPELSIGRIIGNNARALTIPIEASIGVCRSLTGYEFDRSDALVVSGTGEGQKDFEEIVNAVGDILLDAQFNVTKIHWEDYFILSSFSRNYQQHDGFAVGDVMADGRDEIIVGDRSEEEIDILAGDGTRIGLFFRDFQEGDGLAVGDVTGDDKDEIIIGDRNDNIYIYDKYKQELGKFSKDFEQFDGLAAGDVTGDDKDEIIIGDHSGEKIYIYGGDGSLLHSFSRNFQQFDGLAAGDVIGDDKDEIIIGDRSEEEIYIYGGDGSLLHSFSRNFQEGDGLAAGDVGWGSKDEILLGDRNDNLYIYSGTGQELEKIHCDFEQYDGFAVGNVTGGDKDEILVADHSAEKIRITHAYVEDRMFQAFNSSVTNKDVIFFSDHGNPWGWSPALEWKDFIDNGIDLGDAKPFAYAACCSAGTYQGIIDGGIAETFLQYGAAAYIGATETSYGPYDENGAKALFSEWVNTDKPIGLALKEVKQDFVAGGQFEGKFYRRHWVYEFHLYGDPKYGGSSVTTSCELTALTGTDVQGPLSSLDVIVPDYEVTTVEGEDYVEIPDGDMFIVPDKPLVPFYTVSLDYPQGFEVEDVVLTDRSGLTTASGLNIPNATIRTGGETNSGDMGGSEGPEWWPEDVFYWDLFENADGSTTLAISMCPFYYNPLTTDVRFYKDYSFDIDYTVSTVEISRLETDKHVYEQGEQVLVDLEINNSAAETKDILVDAVIEAEDSSEIVGGLFLRTLKGLAGPASFSPHWDSTGFEPGYYYVKVTLKDNAGNVLDRKTELFRLGVCSGEITSFTAALESFDIGDEIGISLAFHNTGTVDISGTALIRVQDESGDIVQEFSHNVTDLAPDDLVSFGDTWDTSGAEQGTYHINGLVFYDGQAAGSAITATTTAEPSDEEPSDGMCFIATAAYGSPMAEEIEILRQFRDEYLLTNPLGQALVDIYYEMSPPIAEFITGHPGLKPVVRAGLLPAVAMSAAAVNTSPIEKMAIIGLLVLASVAVAVWLTRRQGKDPEYTRG